MLRKSCCIFIFFPWLWFQRVWAWQTAESALCFLIRFLFERKQTGSHFVYEFEFIQSVCCINALCALNRNRYSFLNKKKKYSTQKNFLSDFFLMNTNIQRTATPKPVGTTANEKLWIYYNSF